MWINYHVIIENVKVVVKAVFATKIALSAAKQSSLLKLHCLSPTEIVLCTKAVFAVKIVLFAAN